MMILPDVLVVDVSWMGVPELVPLCIDGDAYRRRTRSRKRRK